MEKKTRNMLIAVVSVMLCISMTVVASYALLFKETERKANVFTVGEIGMDLFETKWKSNTSVKLNGGESVDKDPQIKLEAGSTESYVYIEVLVPRKSVYLNRESTNGTPALEEIDLFTYTPNSDWTIISGQTNHNYAYKGKTYSKYVYAYTRSTLKANQTTNTPIFNKVTFADIRDDQADKDEEFDIVVNGYAIQCNYLNETGSTFKDKAINAFDIYLKSASHASKMGG